MSHKQQRKAAVVVLYSPEELFMTLSPMAQYIHAVSTGAVCKVVPKIVPSPPPDHFRMTRSYILLL